MAARFNLTGTSLRAACLLLVTVVVLFSFAPAAAEPVVLRVGGQPIHIEYFPRDEKVAQEVSRICENTVLAIAHELGLEQLQPIRIVLIDDMDEFSERSGLTLPSWGIAFALMDSQFMLVDVARATRSWDQLGKVIPHELSHLLAAQRVDKTRLPVWFVEGLAQWQARQWSMLDGWRLAEAVWGKRASSLAGIRNGLPYGEGPVQDAYRVSYVGFVELFDGHPDALPAFLGRVKTDGDFSVAFAAYFGEDEYEYYARFHQALYRKYNNRLMLFQTGPLFGVLALLFVVIYVRVKIRNRESLKRMSEGDGGGQRDDLGRLPPGTGL